MELERALPEDEEEIFSYLASGICRGVGPAKRGRIVDQLWQSRSGYSGTGARAAEP